MSRIKENVVDHLRDKMSDSLSVLILFPNDNLKTTNENYAISASIKNIHQKNAIANSTII